MICSNNHFNQPFMRNYFLTFVLLVSGITLSNCASGSKQMNNAMNNVYIGMPITEFHRTFPKKETVSLKEGVTIYRVSKRVWYDSDGSGSDYRYFYFVDNELSQVDKGERAVDQRIRIDIDKM